MREDAFVSDTARRSWGGVLQGQHEIATPQFRDEAERLLSIARRRSLPVLGMGCGRSYGDSALNLGAGAIDTTRLDRIMAFDTQNGLIRAEAGATLGDILALVVPRGWFLPTSPGTRFVTLAGAVANDVHGKNHHYSGTFGSWVRRIGLMRSDGALLELADDQNHELFRATIGGLGLTGLILWVEFQLVRIGSAWLDQEIVPFSKLADFFAIARQSDAFEHTVAWIDCTRADASLGRGIFYRANWAQDGRLAAHHNGAAPGIPFHLPAWTLNRVSLRAFNALYYRAQRAKPRQARLHYRPFLYPLDAIRNWNRLYGRQGFYQYQCAIPAPAAENAVQALLRTIAKSGLGSFLIVLKTFGARVSPGLLSFPLHGTTLALDFANHGEETLRLMAQLDAIVAASGGRLYPAKDGRIPPAMFRVGYPDLDRFRLSVDPGFSSSFWRRMTNG